MEGAVASRGKWKVPTLTTLLNGIFWAYTLSAPLEGHGQGGQCCGCKCCFGLDLKDDQAEYPLRAKAAACACIGIFILLSVGMIAAGQFKGNLGMTQGMYRVVGTGMAPTADLVQGGIKPVSGMLGSLIGEDLLSFMENLNATVYPNFRTKVINDNLDCILSSVNGLPDPAELKTTVRD